MTKLVSLSIFSLLTLSRYSRSFYRYSVSEDGLRSTEILSSLVFVFLLFISLRLAYVFCKNNSQDVDVNANSCVDILEARPLQNRWYSICSSLISVLLALISLCYVELIKKYLFSIVRSKIVLI